MGSSGHVWLISVTSWHVCPTASEETLGGRATDDQRTAAAFQAIEKTQAQHAHVIGAGRLRSEIQSHVSDSMADSVSWAYF